MDDLLRILRERQRRGVKVFIATPTSIVKDYCWNDFYARVKALTFKNAEFHVVDNSPDNDYYQKLLKQGVKAYHIKPKHKSNIQYLCESHELLRKLFLRSDCTHMLHLESDVFPPQDVIERLLLHKKPIVSASYFIGQGKESHLMAMHKEDKGFTSMEIARYDGGGDFHFADGKLKKVHSGGLGCALIQKPVLKMINFRWVKDYYAHPDTFFAFDLELKRIDNFIDTSIICEHRNTEWTTF